MNSFLRALPVLATLVFPRQELAAQQDVSMPIAVSTVGTNVRDQAVDIVLKVGLPVLGNPPQPKVYEPENLPETQFDDNFPTVLCDKAIGDLAVVMDSGASALNPNTYLAQLKEALRNTRALRVKWTGLVQNHASGIKNKIETIQVAIYRPGYNEDKPVTYCFVNVRTGELTDMMGYPLTMEPDWESVDTLGSPLQATYIVKEGVTYRWKDEVVRWRRLYASNAEYFAELSRSTEKGYQEQLVSGNQMAYQD